MLISHAPLFMNHSVPATDSHVACQDNRNSDVTDSRACLPVKSSFTLRAAVSLVNFLPMNVCYISSPDTKNVPAAD